MKTNSCDLVTVADAVWRLLAMAGALVFLNAQPW
jgi:hypothetical protein